MDVDRVIVDDHSPEGRPVAPEVETNKEKVQDMPDLNLVKPGFDKSTAKVDVDTNRER
jgi:hypothetical protein